MKNIFNAHQKFDAGKERISELKERSIEIKETVTQRQKEWLKGKEQSIQELWNNIKLSIFTIGMPEGEKRKMDRRNIWGNNCWQRTKIKPNHRFKKFRDC